MVLGRSIPNSSLVDFGGATWDPGETLFIRWRDQNDAGFDQGLGNDDLSFSAVPEPSTMVLAALALAGLAPLAMATEIITS